MNALEESLALAKAWLDGVDDKTFFSEYKSIKEYSNLGPTVDDYIIASSKIGIMSPGFYIQPLNTNTYSETMIFNYNKITSTNNYLLNSACNDENYSLAA